MWKTTNFKLIQIAILLVLVSFGNGFAQNKKGGFVKIFNGKDLTGWDGDPVYWRAEGGSLVGEITPTTPLKTNSFIIWKGGEPGDFELKGDFKISKDGNSGVNYRSDQLTDIPFALRGYQADIDGKNNYTGQNYEERNRTTLAYRGQKTVIEPTEGATRKNNAWTGLKVTGSLGTSDSLKTLIKSEGWNQIRLVVKGNRLMHYINGVLMSDVTDDDPANRKLKGLLGFQVHVGPPMKVEYRNLMIKNL